MPTITPAVLSSRECHDYVGGRNIFLELRALYSDRLLKPMRTTPRGDASWLRETVDAALRLAHSEGALSDRPRVDKAVEAYKRKHGKDSQ